MNIYKSSLAITIYSAIAIMSCSDQSRQDPIAAASGKADSAKSEPQFSLWVRCTQPQCRVFITSDISALPKDWPGAPSGEQATLMMSDEKWIPGGEVFAEALNPAPQGREMGVVLITGSFAVVSWLDTFYIGKVQMVNLLASSGWQLFSKNQPMGKPPADAKPARTVTCTDPNGCKVYATNSQSVEFSDQQYLIGTQPCRAQMGVFVTDSNNDRWIVSYPQPDGHGMWQVQVVQRGQWQSWAEGTALPLGHCAGDAILSDGERCKASGGKWDDSACPTACTAPACGTPFSFGCPKAECGTKATCRCPDETPYWDPQKGCVSGASCDDPTEYPDKAACLKTHCAVAPTCAQAGGSCVEMGPAVEFDCGKGAMVARSAATCPNSATGRLQACCIKSAMPLLPPNTLAPTCTIDGDCGLGGKCTRLFPSTTQPKVCFAACTVETGYACISNFGRIGTCVDGTCIDTSGELELCGDRVNAECNPFYYRCILSTQDDLGYCVGPDNCAANQSCPTESKQVCSTSPLQFSTVDSANPLGPGTPLGVCVPKVSQIGDVCGFDIENFKGRACASGRTCDGINVAIGTYMGTCK